MVAQAVAGTEEFEAQYMPEIKKKKWGKREREAARRRALKMERDRMERRFLYARHRKARVDAIWAKMGKDSYTRDEILQRVKIMDAILRDKFLRGRKVIIEGFGSFWYEIYDYERGGLIGIEGKVMLSVLKVRFRAGKWLVDELERQYRNGTVRKKAGD